MRDIRKVREIREKKLLHLPHLPYLPYLSHCGWKDAVKSQILPISLSKRCPEK
jgi:hypothetical protein